MTRLKHGAQLLQEADLDWSLRLVINRSTMQVRLLPAPPYLHQFVSAFRILIVMTTDRELLTQALSALKTFSGTVLGNTVIVKSAIGAITSRLAEPEDEPVGYFWEPIRLLLDRPDFPPGLTSDVPIIPLYRRPSRQQVRLSDDEIDMLWTIHDTDIDSFARAVEDKVLEKNQ